MSEGGGQVGVPGSPVAAELSALYEISQITVRDSEEELLTDAMERAARIFGLRRGAVVDPESRKVLWSRGFLSAGQVLQALDSSSERVLEYELCSGRHPLRIYAECVVPVKLRCRRLFLVFARQLEQALTATRNLQALEAAQKELRAHRAHLEELVEQRTRQLEESYRRLESEIEQRQRAERERLDLERKAAEARERELLERANRLSSLGMVAAGIAHEINNPLQGILSHLRAVSKALPPGFPRRRSLEMVEQGVKTIAELVRQLLYFGAESSGGRRVADSRQGVEFVCRMLEEEFNKRGIRIDSSRVTERVRVRMPQRDFIQVLLNIFLNSRDAMPHGGTLTVSQNVEGGWYHLTVADTGVGISRKLLSRIFTPFFTTRPGKGTGLGLSVVDSLVRSSGGRVDVESEPGRGTAFHIYLPLAKRRS